MWSGEQDTNELGESVLLLRPLDNSQGNNSRRNKNKNKSSTNNPSLSHVGGFPCYHENDILLRLSSASRNDYVKPKCKRCDQPMYLLLQLHSPLDAVDRTLYVFGCNASSCYSGGNGVVENGESMNSRFQSCIGNATKGGSMRCIRSQQPWKTSKATTPDADVQKSTSTNDSGNPKESPGDNLETNDWGLDDESDGWGEDEDDDWGGGGETDGKKDKADISMDDLETMLTKSEMQSALKESTPVASTKLQSSSASSTKVSNVNTSVSAKSSQEDVPPSFDHHDLEMIDEPPAGRGKADDSDEDDDEDDGECSNVGASKVDQMLSRYLDMEEDEDILSALKGGGKGSADKSNNTGGGGGGGERYERLPPEERAFVAFSQRLKRAPGQVARYAYGGVPLWSIPLQPRNAAKQQQKKQQQKKSKKKNAQQPYSPLPDVPKCECGAERVFEFQILPSLLHVLDVDSHATGPDKGGAADADHYIDLRVMRNVGKDCASAVLYCLEDGACRILELMAGTMF